MQNKINITESDIFRYIFFPDKLSVEKRDYLTNSNVYENEIKFYNALKTSMQSELSFSIKEKIAKKIPAYQLLKIYELHPQRFEQPQAKRSTTILAAASPEIKPEVTVKTFLDDEKSLLIKFLNFGDHSKVYVFSANDEVLTNFKIKFLPQNIEFSLLDNTEPLRTEITSDPDLIRIDFS
jgi:hypothetical protein